MVFAGVIHSRLQFWPPPTLAAGQRRLGKNNGFESFSVVAKSFRLLSEQHKGAGPHGLISTARITIVPSPWKLPASILSAAIRSIS